MFFCFSLFSESVYKKTFGEYNPNGLLERVSGAVRVIDVDHSNVHEGIMYSCYQDTISIADSGSIYFAVVIPDSLEMHLKGANIWAVDQPWSFEIYEAPTFTNGTDTLKNYNRDRNEIDSSGIVIFKTPTSINISSAKRIERILFGGGTGVGGAVSSGSLGKNLEWELKESTKNLIIITNLSGGAATVSIEIYFYIEIEE